MQSSGLSSWWARETHATLRHVTDDIRRLALAIVPVKSIVRVVDDHVPPMTVGWSDRDISYTDFGTGRIAINPLPLVEKKMRTEEALDVVTGFGIHEAAHSKHSRDRYRDLIVIDSDGIERPAFRPMRVAGWLWNLADDIRIEDRTTRDWPGFRAYLDAVLRWMWNRPQTAVSDDPNPHLVRQLKTAFYACRYPDRWRDRLSAKMESEVTWWMAWREDYVTDAVSTKETIQRGLDHLALDEQTASEMDGLATEEQQEEAAGEELRRQIDRLIAEGVKGLVVTTCSSNGRDDYLILEGDMAQRVETLIAEELVERKVIITGKGVANPPLFISKPTETTESRRAYIGRPNAESEALRASLVLRPSVPQYDHKLLRRGRLDDEEVYRWAMGDYRVFSERVIEAKPDTFMGLLVDLSGSMAGPNLKVAQRLAQLFVWALHDQTGIRTRVWGHTGDLEGDSVDIFRIWEEGDPLSRLGLITSSPHANNYDGHAIAWCIDQIKDEPETQRVLIVLSDGQPSGTRYGGEPAFRHILGVVRAAHNHYDIDVIQIAIDKHLDLDHQVKMFGSNVVPYVKTAALPRQLTRVMGRFS